MRGVVTCLLYHRVDDPARIAFLQRGGSPVIAAEDLERDLRFLQGIGVHFLTFADLRAGHFVGREEIGIIVSFDDCFRDNYTTGLALLERLGVKAVFFQTSAFIDSAELQWEQALYWHSRDDGHAAQFRERARPYFPEPLPADPLDAVAWIRESAGPDRIDPLLAEMEGDDEAGAVASAIYPRAEDVRKAQALGHEIGSHGHRHLKRTSIDAACFERDLADSQHALARVLGQPVAAFSYPFNSYERADGPITRRYFAQAATVDSQRITRDTDPLWIPRFTWPGPPPNALRRRRWLLTGRI
jgi:peptidoglycan/xylan/chitin deacetylase (PgdA/CDA1 family)